MHDKGQLISDRGRLWLQTAHMLHIHMGAEREEGRKEGWKDERKEDDKINFNLTKQLFN